MHSFSYKSFTTVCVVLLLGGGCASEEASQAPALGALDAGPTPDAEVPSAQDAAGPVSASNGPRPAAGRGDAGARSTDADSDAAVSTASEGASAGSGGSESKPASSSRAGSGGANAGASTARAGAGGQPAARAGAGGTSTSSMPAAGGGATAGSGAQGGAGAGGAPAREDEAGSGGSAGERSDREPTECELIADACAAVTAPSDDVTACLDVGNSDDASMCRARFEDCRQTCGAPLCEQVLVECPDGEDEGPVQGCHQIGVTDNAGDCFGDGVKCLEFCRMVVTP